VNPKLQQVQSGKKRQRAREEEQQRQQQQAELRRQEQEQAREEEQKKQQQQAEWRRQEAERARVEKEQRRQQQDEECRQLCPHRLAAMLDELRSLKTDNAGFARMQQLAREREALSASMPNDVRERRTKVYDDWHNEYSKRSKEFDDWKRAEGEVVELKMFYLAYLELQFCAQRFPYFEEAKTVARDAATARPDRSESGFPKDSEGASLTH
jgi:hypothetical protein